MIVICDDCDGTGYQQFDVGSHKTEYETVICKKCGGSGRLVQETQVTEEPFVPGPNISKRIF